MRKTILTIAAGVALSGCAVIQPGNVGVKVTMGKLDSNSLNPGIHMYNPFLEGITVYDCKQTTIDGKCTPLTVDQQPITLFYKVQLKIPQGQVLTLFSKYSADPYQQLVDPQVQEAFRQVVSHYKADQTNKNLDTIRTLVLSQVRTNLNGLVQVEDIPIQHLDLPPDLLKAIAQKQVMEQTALQKTYELEKAQKQAQITVAEAEAQAKSIQLQSEALTKSPALIEYERVKKWDGKYPTTYISGADAKPLLLINKP